MLSKVDRVQNYYETGFQHLQDELKRVDLLIHRQVLRIRHERYDGIPEEHMGLFILDEEVDDLLEKETLESDKKDNKSVPSTPEIEALNTYLQQVSLCIADKASESLNKRVYLPIFHLMSALQLTPFEMDCLLILLATELDLKYERLYAYLQNDVTKKKPTVGLVLDLLCTSPEEKARVRAIFTSDNPLIRYHLIEFPDKSPDRCDLLISRPMKLDERIVNFLLEIEDVDSRISNCVKIVEPRVSLKDLIIPAELKEKVSYLSLQINKNAKNNTEMATQIQFTFYLKGPPDNSQHQVAEAICHALGLGLLEVDMGGMSGSVTPLCLGLKLIFRETLLRPLAVYVRGFDGFLDEGVGNGHRATLLNAIAEYDGFLFLESEKNWEPEFRSSLARFFMLDFNVPPYSIRKDLWEHHLDSYQVRNGFNTADLANKFQLTGGQIKDAIATAISMASMRSDDKASVTMEDILEGCRATSNQKLISLARKIQPRYGWNDIVLPRGELTQLKEICNYVKYQHVVYDDWGFDMKFSQGKGLNILFHGPSGTGKTMAAEVIAKKLGLDLYKLDLSCVVSKYIGETEKNLNRIFAEAETSNCILFFDEADALFGKRSEVRDAHDRYANIEVAYLLQKMEEYEGIVILATNLLKNMDDAFTRRMHFSVEFPFPDEESRLKIWESMFPKTTPRADDIAFKFLAKKFKIAGGNIKNIALLAAFLAADGSGIIDMKCIIRAAKREFQKMGILSIPSDFGEYYDLTLES